LLLTEAGAWVGQPTVVYAWKGPAGCRAFLFLLS
jgi:hypothetical protein